MLALMTMIVASKADYHHRRHLPYHRHFRRLHHHLSHGLWHVYHGNRLPRCHESEGPSLSLLLDFPFPSFAEDLESSVATGTSVVAWLTALHTSLSEAK